MEITSYKVNNDVIEIVLNHSEQAPILPSQRDSISSNLRPSNLLLQSFNAFASMFDCIKRFCCCCCKRPAASLDIQPSVQSIMKDMSPLCHELYKKWEAEFLTDEESTDYDQTILHLMQENAKVTYVNEAIPPEYEPVFQQFVIDSGCESALVIDVDVED